MNSIAQENVFSLELQYHLSSSWIALSPDQFVWTELQRWDVFHLVAYFNFRSEEPRFSSVIVYIRSFVLFLCRRNSGQIFFWFLVAFSCIKPALSFSQKKTRDRAPDIIDCWSCSARNSSSSGAEGRKTQSSVLTRFQLPPSPRLFRGAPSVCQLYLQLGVHSCETK